MGKGVVVLDTNVIVSAAFSPASPPALAFERVVTQFVPLVSEETLGELNEVLLRPHIVAAVPEERLQRLLLAYRRASVLLRPTVSVEDSPDPDDAIFFQLAVTGRASFFVTGDKRLWALDPYGEVGTRVVSPRAFLDIDLP